MINTMQISQLFRDKLTIPPGLTLTDRDFLVTCPKCDKRQSLAAASRYDAGPESVVYLCRGCEAMLAAALQTEVAFHYDFAGAAIMGDHCVVFMNEALVTMVGAKKSISLPAAARCVPSSDAPSLTKPAD